MRASRVEFFRGRGMATPYQEPPSATTTSGSDRMGKLVAARFRGLVLLSALAGCGDWRAAGVAPGGSAPATRSGPDGAMPPEAPSEMLHRFKPFNGVRMPPAPVAGIGRGPAGLACSPPSAL